MRFLLPVVLLLSLNTAVANNWGGIKVKVLSYNALCSRCDGDKPNIEDWHDIRDRVWYDTFDAVDPDIAGLQEVLGKYHWPGDHQPPEVINMYAEITERYGFEYTFYGYGVDGTSLYPNMDHNNLIMFRTSKFDLVDSGHFWLSETPDERSTGWDADNRRIATWVKLEEKASGFRFYVYDTHLDHVGSVARSESAKLLAARIEEQRNDPLYEPVLLMGDFNAGPGSTPVQYLVNPPGQTLKFEDTICRATAALCNKSTRPTLGFGPARIDYILSTVGTFATSAELVGDVISYETYPSDHLGVVADVELWAPVMPGVMTVLITSMLL